MEFKKYPSIESYENTKAREAVFDACNEEREEELFVVYEKVDGANFQLCFTPHEPLKVGRRNAWIGDDEPFFDFRGALVEYKDDINKLQAWVDGNTGSSLRVYGELFGPKVQSRIPYSKKLCITVFDIVKNDEFMSPRDLEWFLLDLQLGHMMVPRVDFVHGIANMKEYMKNVGQVQSKIAMGHAAEGVVIRPFHRNYHLKVGLAVLKYRNEAFFEIQKNPKGDRAQFKELDQHVNAFKEYFNANRACSVVSKLGKPKDKPSIAGYIRELQKDALADFMKDHPDLSDFDLDKLSKHRVKGCFQLFLPHLE